jgi:hypothetical protein
MRLSANRDESQCMDVRVGLAGQMLLTAGDRTVDEEAPAVVVGGSCSPILSRNVVAA